MTREFSDMFCAENGFIQTANLEPMFKRNHGTKDCKHGFRGYHFSHKNTIFALVVAAGNAQAQQFNVHMRQMILFNFSCGFMTFKWLNRLIRRHSEDNTSAHHSKGCCDRLKGVCKLLQATVSRSVVFLNVCSLRDVILKQRLACCTRVGPTVKGTEIPMIIIKIKWKFCVPSLAFGSFVRM